MILRKCKGNNTYRLKHKQVKVVSQYTIVAYTLLSLTVHSNNTVGFLCFKPYEFQYKTKPM